jgi:3-oxoacyl-(acyl-carrier-protein) synthase III
MLRPNIGILGTGFYVPEKVLTNAELESSLNLEHNWIKNKTGICERRVAAPYEATSDLATNAAEQALVAAGIRADELDLVVMATSTPDWPLPATACQVQANIGATKAAAFDISAVCAGFVYALVMTHAAMQGNAGFKKALIVGAETYSRILDYQDRRTCVLFGDGAGAVVLGQVPEGYGVLSSYIRSDGTGTSMVQIPAGGSRRPTSSRTMAEREHFFRMDGRAVRNFFQQTFADALYTVIDAAHLHIEDVDLIVPHQANGVLLQERMQFYDIPLEKVYFTLERYGNTAAASVPITLHEAVTNNRLQDGNTVLLLSYGAGMTWGSALLRWYNAS